MSFARSPNSWGSNDSLGEFPSETPPDQPAVQMIIVPGISIAERLRGNDVGTSPNRVHDSKADLRTARRLGTRSRRSRRRALSLVAQLATGVRRLRGSINAIRAPRMMGRVLDLLPLAGRTTLRSFAVGATAGILVMWFASAEPPLSVGPSTTQAVTLKPTPPPPDRPASVPNVQPAAEGMRPIVPRGVGTSGYSTSNRPRAVRPSRVAASPSTSPGKAAATPRAPYRGSLAFRSSPEGARVFVNGTFVGSTPLTLENLPVGSRAVRIEADGYQRWSASTQVVANQQRRVSATLGRAVP